MKTSKAKLDDMPFGKRARIILELGFSLTQIKLPKQRRKKKPSILIFWDQ